MKRVPNHVVHPRSGGSAGETAVDWGPYAWPDGKCQKLRTKNERNKRRAARPYMAIKRDWVLRGREGSAGSTQKGLKGRGATEGTRHLSWGLGT